MGCVSVPHDCLLCGRLFSAASISFVDRYGLFIFDQICYRSFPSNWPRIPFSQDGRELFPGI